MDRSAGTVVPHVCLFVVCHGLNGGLQCPRGSGGWCCMALMLLTARAAGGPSVRPLPSPGPGGVLVVPLSGECLAASAVLVWPS
jgi:hypothetical protein